MRNTLLFSKRGGGGIKNNLHYCPFPISPINMHLLAKSTVKFRMLLYLYVGGLKRKKKLQLNLWSILQCCHWAGLHLATYDCHHSMTLTTGLTVLSCDLSNKHKYGCIWICTCISRLYVHVYITKPRYFVNHRGQIVHTLPLHHIERV